MNTIHFDKHQISDRETQARLQEVEHRRTGTAKATLAGPLGAPIAVKVCKYCKTPAPMTTTGRFVCRSCVLIFD